MRKTKRIKIDDREITVFELRVKDIRRLLDRGDADLSLSALPEYLELACDMPADQFNEMAPSEVAQIWEAFREVNDVFFGWTAKAGIDRMFKNLIEQHLTAASAVLSKKDMLE